jgi:hypothetical protein
VDSFEVSGLLREASHWSCYNLGHLKINKNVRETLGTCGIVFIEASQPNGYCSTSSLMVMLIKSSGAEEIR